MKYLLSSLVATTALSLASHAAVVSVSSLHAHNNWNNFGGNLADLTSGEEMTKTDPDDPSTWALTSSAYQASWQADDRLDSGTSHNSKIGWAALDFGSVVSNLDQFYIWNLRDTAAVRAVNTYNIYYAGASITAFPATPTAANSEVDYSFTGGNGWTLFNGSPLTLASPSGTGAQAVIDLGGIDARYLAIEILTAKGGTATDRVGLNEVAVTFIPEPASALLGGLGLLGILRRRR